VLRGAAIAASSASSPAASQARSEAAARLALKQLQRVCLSKLKSYYYNSPMRCVKAADVPFIRSVCVYRTLYHFTIGLRPR